MFRFAIHNYLLAISRLSASMFFSPDAVKRSKHLASGNSQAQKEHLLRINDQWDDLFFRKLYRKPMCFLTIKYGFLGLSCRENPSSNSGS